MPKHLILLIFFAQSVSGQGILPFGKFKQNLSISKSAYNSKFDFSGKEQGLSSQVSVDSNKIKSRLSGPLKQKVFSTSKSNLLNYIYSYQLDETQYKTDFYYGLLPNLTVGINLSWINQQIKISKKSNTDLSALSKKEKELFGQASKEVVSSKLKDQSKNLPEDKDQTVLGDIRFSGVYDPHWGSSNLNLLGELTLPSGQANDNYELIQVSPSGNFSFGLGFVLSPFQTKNMKTNLRWLSRLNFDQAMNMSVYDKNNLYLGEDSEVTVNTGIENQIDLELSQKFFKSFNLMMGLSYFERDGGKVEGQKFDRSHYSKYVSDLYTNFQSYSVEFSKAFKFLNKETSFNIKYQSIFKGINVYKSQYTQLGMSYLY